MERIKAVFRPESKYRAFFLSVMTFSLAYGLYKGVIDNYLAEVVGMSGFDKGVSEFFRELPGLLLVFMCGLAVFSYIVSMIPAGLFGVAITRENTTTQSVYDIQNLTLTVICLAICAVGGMFLARKTGEADAMYAFRNHQERKIDKRYLLLSVALAVLVYFIVSAVFGLSFFAGPIRYLGIFLSRAEREGRVVSAGDDLPKSFLLCRDRRGDVTVYLSQLATASLLKRLESDRFELA